MGKRGLCVNVRDPRGLELMHRLVDGADVFVENYRPGALKKLGLGNASLAERNPRLVYCSISAYGHSGPDSDNPGFGLPAEAKSGAMAMIGMPGEAPPLFRIALADMYTGIHGVAAVNAALLGRVTSGRGQHIDLALLIGQHNRDIAASLGYTGEEIEALTGDSVLHEEDVVAYLTLVHRLRKCRWFSRRNRRIFSYSAMLNPPPRWPSSHSACTTQLESPVWKVQIHGPVLPQSVRCELIQPSGAGRLTDAALSMSA